MLFKLCKFPPAGIISYNTVFLYQRSVFVRLAERNDISGGKLRLVIGIIPAVTISAVLVDFLVHYRFFAVYCRNIAECLRFSPVNDLNERFRVDKKSWIIAFFLSLKHPYFRKTVIISGLCNGAGTKNKIVYLTPAFKAVASVDADNIADFIIIRSNIYNALTVV